LNLWWNYTRESKLGLLSNILAINTCSIGLTNEVRRENNAFKEHIMLFERIEQLAPKLDRSFVAGLDRLSIA